LALCFGVLVSSPQARGYSTKISPKEKGA